MELDSDIGHIVITHPNGDESHILLPIDPGDFDFAHSILNPIVSILTDSLGSYESVKDETFEEERLAGVYTLDKKTYCASNYELNFIQDEFYCGASGGTEQIILSILAGVAGGISTAITTQIYNKISQYFSADNSDAGEAEAGDTTYLKTIEKIVIKRFNAEPPLNFSNAKYLNKKITFEVFDSKNNKFIAKINNSNGSFLIDIERT